LLIEVKYLNMLDNTAQALREQIIGKCAHSWISRTIELIRYTANATLLFFLRRGSKEGFSDPIIAVMWNGKDTSASVVAIKGGASIVTLVVEVSAASDMCALQAVFERSKIDLALAMHLAKENRKDDFGGVAKGE
jgi:hypothetical protein